MATSTTTTKAAVSKLDKTILSTEVTNHELLKLAYEAYLANIRAASAKTKPRGEVSGGGKKPWRQKGTGRARFGSTRNPIWRHGGVAFGPTGLQNFKKQLNTTAKHVALRQALSLADKAGKFVTIADVKTTGKTKDIVKLLADNKVDARRVLLVVDAKTPELIRASRNLENVELIRATYLSVFHILNADKIVMTNAAVAAVNEWLGGNK